MFYQNKCRNRIKELRLAHNHATLRDFVRVLNKELEYEVSTATISMLESHKRENPSWELVDLLCDYFDVTPDYLMGRTDIRCSRNTDKILKPLIEKKSEEAKPEQNTSDVQLPPECELVIAEFEARMKQAFLSYMKNNRG